jgi:hypothetical protein
MSFSLLALRVETSRLASSVHRPCLQMGFKRTKQEYTKYFSQVSRLEGSRKLQVGGFVTEFRDELVCINPLVCEQTETLEWIS